MDAGVGQEFAVEGEGGVLSVGGADGEGAGDGAVVDGLASDMNNALRVGVGRSTGWRNGGGGSLNDNLLAWLSGRCSVSGGLGEGEQRDGAEGS